jgi:hypothetical protein
VSSIVAIPTQSNKVFNRIFVFNLVFRAGAFLLLVVNINGYLTTFFAEYCILLAVSVMPEVIAYVLFHIFAPAVIATPNAAHTSLLTP